jgi:hypothetical protein
LRQTGPLGPRTEKEIEIQMLKKQIRKDDGRYLIYYHNPETATPEQTAAFASIEAPAEAVATGKNHGEHGETRRDSETPISEHLNTRTPEHLNTDPMEVSRV